MTHHERDRAPGTHRLEMRRPRLGSLAEVLSLQVEATPGVERGCRGFAGHRVATWLRRLGAVGGTGQTRDLAPTARSADCTAVFGRSTIPLIPTSHRIGNCPTETARARWATTDPADGREGCGTAFTNDASTVKGA